MILSDIRKFMKARGRASLDDLKVKFDTDHSAIEGMMETLKAHGQVFEAGCGSCGGSAGCSIKGPRIYVWVTKGKGENSDDGLSRCDRPT